jgi:hypothetical protein
MKEAGFHFDLVNYKPRDWDNWIEGWQKLRAALAASGLPKTEHHEALSVPAGYLSNIVSGSTSERTKHSTMAEKIAIGLRSQATMTGKDEWKIGRLHSQPKKLAETWNGLEEFRCKLADRLDDIISSEREARAQREITGLVAQAASGKEHRVTKVTLIPDAAPETPTAPAAIDPDVFLGRTTGQHWSWTDDLFLARAEWQHTNLGPDESPWLLLYVSFGEASTLDRPSSSRLPIRLDSVWCYVTLDGATASGRGNWEENSANGLYSMAMSEMAAWIDTRPVYMMRSAESKASLVGLFDFFRLCEVSGEAGLGARVDFYTMLNGLTINMPDTIRKRLDIDAANEYDCPEDRLLNHWLRLRCVPKASGGRFCLQTIFLNKDDPANG